MNPKFLKDSLPRVKKTPSFLKISSSAKKSTKVTFVLFSQEISSSNLCLPARDQGQCGSSWVFLAISNEANYVKKGGV